MTDTAMLPCAPGLHDDETEGTASLDGWGAYKRLRCRRCHRVAYHRLPD